MSHLKNAGLLPLIFLLCLPLSFRGAQEPVAPKPEALSPYLIEWYLDIDEDADLNRIWRSLKMEVPGDLPSRCDGDCSAETFDIRMADEEAGGAVALRVSLESAGFYQYLIFKKVRLDSGEKEEWKFLGRIDSRGQRDGPPQHRVEHGSGRTWLVVRELWGREAAVTARGEAWHEVSESGIRRVLSYPIEGQDRPCENRLGRSYKAILLRHGLEDGIYTVPLRLLVSYNISDCDRAKEPHPILARGQKASYVWDGDKERFVLDPSRSDVTEKEMSSVYGLEGPGRDQFLEFNFDQLSILAKDGDAKQRGWLREFLTSLPDSPRKAALQERLQQ